LNNKKNKSSLAFVQYVKCIERRPNTWYYGLFKDTEGVIRCRKSKDRKNTISKKYKLWSTKDIKTGNGYKTVYY